MIGVWVWIVKFAGDEGRILVSGFLGATSVSLCLCGELLLSNLNHRGTETQRLHRKEFRFRTQLVMKTSY